MVDRVEIRGGAGEFEAAVIAVVLDQIARDELTERQGKVGSPRPGLSAWVTALHPEQPHVPLGLQVGVPREVTWPDD